MTHLDTASGPANLSSVMLLLVEAYSRFTAQYMVIGGFRTTSSLQEALRRMDPNNRRTIRVSVLSTEDIRGPHGRKYYTAAEVLEW